MLTMDSVRRALRWLWEPAHPEPAPVDLLTTGEALRRRNEILLEQMRWQAGRETGWWSDYDGNIPVEYIGAEWMHWEAVTWPWPWTIRDTQNLHELMSSLPAYGTIHVRD